MPRQGDEARGRAREPRDHVERDRRRHDRRGDPEGLLHATGDLAEDRDLLAADDEPRPAPRLEVGVVWNPRVDAGRPRPEARQDVLGQPLGVVDVDRVAARVPRQVGPGTRERERQPAALHHPLARAREVLADLEEPDGGLLAPRVGREGAEKPADQVRLQDGHLLAQRVQEPDAARPLPGEAEGGLRGGVFEAVGDHLVEPGRPKRLARDIGLPQRGRAVHGAQDARR